MAAEETTAFGSVPRKRRTGPTTPNSVNNRAGVSFNDDLAIRLSYANVPSPTARLDTLVDVVADDATRLERSRNEAQTKDAREYNKKHSPPSFAPSPPVSPIANTALAAVAAAAAANAGCKTWISGSEPKRGGENFIHNEEQDICKLDDDAVHLENCSTSDFEQDFETGDEVTPGGKSAERRSLRRRSANSRFQPYHTDTTGAVFEGSTPGSGRGAARKRLDSHAEYVNACIGEERKFERALEQIQLQFGKKHPEVGKALLQIARHCYARQQREKAERYLVRSWDVFKCHADRSTNMQESFESFLSLFEDYQCSENVLESVRREIFSMSPVSANHRGFKE
mmetsp:Transcript_32918/g.45695  ORF Transcript_32918/g.45695 Transcript_32918/m.45695 type:complete len:340 (+) Transcript_32918:91-1110(+)|eukprot:CAMPEP_0196585438 /NCGR_PEP_ID=MMETSP1081-20130531/50648_1 /TAXON_ID=36882 /ORGANISM="Pyramimonas amylifera, Strain CCMP720" /LENGTH=339 /DNA_ID=CAMNT_0041906975 /DNA_START=218 /DNA_END=1237 /DNA_ORIENTATION=-